MAEGLEALKEGIDIKQLRFAVRGRGAKFAGLSLGERLLTLEIVFHIFNPNQFPVAIDRAKYRIYFREGGDVKIGEGSIDGSVYIPAYTAEYAKSEVKTPLSGDLARMLIHQMEKARTTLDFEGIAHLATPEGAIDMTFKFYELRSGAPVKKERTLGYQSQLHSSSSLR